MNSYADYNNSIFNAFLSNSKQTDIINKKTEIFNKVFEYHNHVPDNYLFVGFNPFLLTLKGKNITLTETNETIFSWISNQNITVNKLGKNENKFDCIIAMDEYLTFCENDDQFREKINVIGNLCSNLFVTSVKDYKNQDFREREYSIPAVIKTAKSTKAYIEIHDWSINDRSSFKTYLYELSDNSSRFNGQYIRKPIYFKQMARFCLDLGVTDFLVHKNIMYKSLIKKNYEHVISVNFQKEFDN